MRFSPNISEIVANTGLYRIVFLFGVQSDRSFSWLHSHHFFHNPLVITSPALWHFFIAALFLLFVCGARFFSWCCILCSQVLQEVRWCCYSFVHFLAGQKPDQLLLTVSKDEPTLKSTVIRIIDLCKLSSIFHFVNLSFLLTIIFSPYFIAVVPLLSWDRTNNLPAAEHSILLETGIVNLNGHLVAILHPRLHVTTM